MSSVLRGPVLVTGATGYVGSRLIPCLLSKQFRVRALVRPGGKERSMPWAGRAGIEVVIGDVLDPVSLERALSGCSCAYYLVHSMRSGGEHFAERDREAARNMAKAAEKAGIERLIYLTGLGEEGESLSRHLRSRREVEGILRSGSVPVTALRAAMIIGAGSASFEILRYLVERLPIMVTPRWVSTESQPIAIRNVLHYLVECLESPKTIGETFEIGGTDRLTYRHLMELYGEAAGLPRRIVFPVPVLTPRLSSYWIHLVTPVHASLARPLAEGLRNRVIVRDERIRSLIPQSLLSAREALKVVMDERQHYLKAPEEAAFERPPEWSHAGDPPWAGGTVYEDRRRGRTEAGPRDLWQALTGLGGREGWYYADWLWSLRGLIDRLVGGVGLRKAQDPDGKLQEGGHLGFWRIERCEAPKRLLLVAEMKLPGLAVLDFRIRENEDGSSELEQTARFVPRGLGGILYWYVVLPAHQLVFGGLMRGIIERAERSSAKRRTA